MQRVLLPVSFLNIWRQSGLYYVLVRRVAMLTKYLNETHAGFFADYDDHADPGEEYSILSIISLKTVN